MGWCKRAPWCDIRNEFSYFNLSIEAFYKCLQLRKIFLLRVLRKASEKGIFQSWLERFTGLSHCLSIRHQTWIEAQRFCTVNRLFWRSSKLKRFSHFHHVRSFFQQNKWTYFHLELIIIFHIRFSLFIFFTLNLNIDYIQFAMFEITLSLYLLGWNILNETKRSNGMWWAPTSNTYMHRKHNIELFIFYSGKAMMPRSDE